MQTNDTGTHPPEEEAREQMKTKQINQKAHSSSHNSILPTSSLWQVGHNRRTKISSYLTGPLTSEKSKIVSNEPTQLPKFSLIYSQNENNYLQIKKPPFRSRFVKMFSKSSDRLSEILALQAVTLSTKF